MNISKSAIKQIQKLSAERPESEELLRILVKPGGCSGFEYGMSFDHKNKTDILLEKDGISIIIDPESAEYLKNCSIDFDDGLHGKGFEINNPNANSTCGCGKSFN